MSDSIIHIQSITQMHDIMGFEKPQHPLISVIDVSRFNVPDEFINQRFSTDFYTISMKDGSCGMLYGRNYYDFEEGVLAFTAPGQVSAASRPAEDLTGWLLIFHPDILLHTNLANTIDSYTFFSYDVHEALHLSQKEEEILNDCVQKIEFEYNQNIDRHSQSLFASHLELMLNYCLRFYERQFNTRSNHHKDVVTQIESLIKSYYTENKQLEHGALTTKFLADEVHLSANYLGDLLKKETGKNTKDHINDYVVKRAKNMLLSTTNNVNEIAYHLGFNYPHYFSRLFKQKTGYTPQKYRELN